MTARDAYSRGFADGWADAQEHNRRRAQRWAQLWLTSDHHNDTECAVCLAGWSLLDTDDDQLVATT